MKRDVARSFAGLIAARLERVKDVESGMPESKRIDTLATAVQDVLDIVMQMVEAIPEQIHDHAHRPDPAVVRGEPAPPPPPRT